MSTNDKKSPSPHLPQSMNDVSEDFDKKFKMVAAQQPMTENVPLFAAADDDEMNHTWSSMNGTLSIGNSDMDEINTIPTSPNRNFSNKINIMKGKRPIVVMDPPKEEESSKNDDYSDKSSEDFDKTTVVNKCNTIHKSQESAKEKNNHNKDKLLLLPNSDSPAVLGGNSENPAKGTSMSTIAEELVLIMDPSTLNNQISPQSTNESLTNKSVLSSNRTRHLPMNDKGGDKNNNNKNKKSFRLFRRKKSNCSTTAASSSDSFNSSNFNLDTIDEPEEMESAQKSKKGNVVRSILTRRRNPNPTSHKKSNDRNDKDSLNTMSPATTQSLSSQNLTLLSEQGSSTRDFLNTMDEGIPSSSNINFESVLKKDENKFDFPNFSLTHGEDGFPKIMSTPDSVVPMAFVQPKINLPKINSQSPRPPPHPNNNNNKQDRRSRNSRITNTKKQNQLVDPGIAKREMLMSQLVGNGSNPTKSSNKTSGKNAIKNRRTVRFSDCVNVPEDHQSVAESFIHADDSCISSMTGTVDKINRQLRRRHEIRRQQLLENDKAFPNQTKVNGEDNTGNDRFLGKIIHIRHTINNNMITTSSSYEDTFEETTTEGDDFYSSYAISRVRSLPTDTSEDNSHFLERVLEVDEDRETDDPHMLFIRQKAQAFHDVKGHPNYDECSSECSSHISSRIITEDWSCSSHTSSGEIYGKPFHDIQRHLRDRNHHSIDSDSFSEDEYIDDRIHPHHPLNMYP